MRKTVLLLLIFCFTLFNSFAQYWQQEVNYSIDVSLDDTAHSLKGFERIEYINNSPDTLRFIWFHIWPNAYKNDKTAFSDQLLNLGKTDFYFSGKEQKGYINRMDFRVDNNHANVEDHPEHIDIIKVLLPTPLPPGKKITITTPFHVQLPYNFSRGGHDGQSYQVTQWFPKPAVYDKQGWHPMPYLEQGEYYSEFGSFEVNITVPENYIVAATGKLQNPEANPLVKVNADSLAKELNKPLTLSKQKTKNLPEQFPPSSKTLKTLKFKQDKVHDFAWFADKRYVVNFDTMVLASGKKVEIYAYYKRPGYAAWQNAVKAAKNAIRHYSGNVGEYPYDIVSVVEGPESFGGGMEYPTITVISPIADAKMLEQVIVHEVGHNWFYGILASNERDHPWMDEGINSFYDEKYRVQKFGDYPKMERVLFETKAITKTDQPANLASQKYTGANYDLVVYYKSAEWLRYLEKQLGPDLFSKAMKNYYEEWKFRHPQPDDFKRSFEKTVGKNLDAEFALLNNKGILPNQQRSGTKKAFVFGISQLTSYARVPSKELILFGPAVGVNSYDKLMAGAFVTNIKLPPSSFQYLLAPMYAFGSKKFTGLGVVSYSVYPDKIFQQVDIGVIGSTFTADEFTDNNGKKNHLGFSRIVPGVKFTLKEKDPLSHVHRFIQFRSFLIGEDRLRFYRDTVISGIDTTISDKYELRNVSRTVHQLRLRLENNRVLYPYNGEIKLESGQYFIRSSFTGNYFFNYPKQGGLNLRLFAGKFFYTSSKTSTKQFATSRYHLNMSGPNGYEDYTYSDYFAGRNHFEGWQSQQMMIRDGAFKVRTELLADEVGKTDDWLVAANLTSSIPANINPFMLLPFKLPVKLFFDIGTYAEAWKEDSGTDRFLYGAGIYLPLLKETVNIYIPLFYSGVYDDYYKSTIAKKERFWKKITFSIDISNFTLRKFDRNLSF